MSHSGEREGTNLGHATEDFESNWDEICDNFDNMGLKEDLLRGIYAYGFEKPSAIQQRAIVPLTKKA